MKDYPNDPRSMPGRRRHSLALFQQMAHVNMTGEFDADTENMMKQPRCGCPDINASTKRRKRFDAQSKLSRNKLVLHQMISPPT